jgi:ATP-dependent RNA helicase SUPV3L1/SUV3
LLLLWALHGGQEHGLEAEALPERPKQGLTSVPADNAIPEPYWRTAGFHVVGARAVRIDMLERLSDLIRARVTWRPTPAEPWSNRAEATPADPPPGATGDGGFRVVPELMSMVGCSGEEFASILRALGFRLERRKIEPTQDLLPEAKPDATEFQAAQPEGAPSKDSRLEETEQPIAEGGPEAAMSSAPVEPAPAPDFDEVWRPSKRRDGSRPQRRARKGQKLGDGRSKHASRHVKGTGNKSKGTQDGQRRGRGHAQDRQRQPKREPMRPEHSPFAALKDLRDSLATRDSPDGS